MKLRPISTSLSLGLTLLLTACSAPESTEDLRIVTLGSAVTEIACALGATDSLVAVDSSSRFPANVNVLPKVGYFRTISAEGVLSMRPTLVLAGQGAGPETALTRIQEAGVQVLEVHKTPTMESVSRAIEEIGKALGREKEAGRLIADLNNQLRGAEKKRDSFEKNPRVVFLMSIVENGGLNAAGRGTAADEMIRLAGGVNVMADVSDYRSVSAEALASREPDVILYSAGFDGSPGEVGGRLNEPWAKATPAGLHGRTYPIDIGYYLVLGPRIGQAVHDLMALIHE
ncbi:MAG: ABC transporter substrate-binding protein [Opitutales bacterium]